MKDMPDIMQHGGNHEALWCARRLGKLPALQGMFKLGDGFCAVLIGTSFVKDPLNFFNDGMHVGV